MQLGWTVHSPVPIYYFHYCFKYFDQNCFWCTGLPIKNKISQTTVENLFSPFLYVHVSLQLAVNFFLCQTMQYKTLTARKCRLLQNVHCYKTSTATVKPSITNPSEKFIKCRLDNFLMSLILYYVNFSICENK